MRSCLIFASPIAALAIGGVSGWAQEPRSIDDAEAYAVYRSLLPEEWTVKVARASQLVIQRETATHNQCFPSGPPMEREWAPVVANFKSENATVRHVLPNRALGYPYIVVPRAEILAIFDLPSIQPTFDNPGSGSRLPTVSRLPGPDDGWKAFYDRHPNSGGYMQFSAVGFDETKTRAVVYIAHHCGNLCGGGTHHLLEKVQGVWRRATVRGITQCIWMS